MINGTNPATEDAQMASDTLRGFMSVVDTLGLSYAAKIVLMLGRLSMFLVTLLVICPRAILRGP